MKALIVSCGMGGKRVVPVRQIRVISEKFILVDGLEKLTKQWEHKAGKLIRDTTGQLIGYVTDFALDERKMDVIAIEMAGGYLFRRNRNRLWVYHYSVSPDGEFIIPAALYSELVESSDFWG